MIKISISEADKHKPIDQIEKTARSEWDRTPSLQAEFKEFGNFVSYCRAVAGGKIRVLGRK